jgi:hypothetical protein
MTQRALIIYEGAQGPPLEERPVLVQIAALLAGGCGASACARDAPVLLGALTSWPLAKGRARSS